MSKDLSWKGAIIEVLTDEGEAMNCADIAEQIVEGELRESLGATPADNVNSVISASIHDEGDESPIYRGGRGSRLHHARDFFPR